MTRASWRLQVQRAILLLVLLGIWEFVSARKIIDPLLIGRPSGIFLFLWDGLFVLGKLWLDLAWTMAGTFVAFIGGSVAGILVGLLFVAKPWLDALLSPLLTGLNAMPRIALAPLFLIWFGLGLGSKIALGFSLSFFVVLYATMAGARGVQQDHITLAQTLGAKSVQTFRLFTLPSAVPVIFSALRLALIFSMLGVVGCELIAAEYGLGQAIAVMAANFSTDGVFGVILLLSMIGVGLSGLMSWMEDHLLQWR